MRRILFYALVIVLGGCASDTLRNAPESAASYKAALQRDLETGQAFTHFPGLIECLVTARTERYTAAEMESLDQFAQQPTRTHAEAANKVFNQERSRVTLNDQDYGWQKCGQIRAEPHAFSDAHDLITRYYSGRMHDSKRASMISAKMQSDFVECTWTVLQHRLNAQELQELDDYATGKAGITYMIAERIDIDFLDINTYCPSVTTELMREMQWYRGYNDPSY